MKKNNQPIEWYKLLLVLIGAFGVVLALFHWYTTGVDIPNGLLTILTLIISATLGPNAISSVASTFRSSKQVFEDEPVEDTIDEPILAPTEDK